MCNDDGCVMDDGVVVKLGENDYYFTTSTGRAGQTTEWIRYHTRFDNWDFHLVNLTDAMGVINLSGPNARKVLAKVVDIDISNAAFPFAAYREFIIKDTVFVRAMRLGFRRRTLLRIARAVLLYAGGLGHAQGGRGGIRHPQLRRGSPERAAHGKMPHHPGPGVGTAHQFAGRGPGILWDRTKADAKTVGAVALRQAENDSGRLKLVGLRMEDDTRPPATGP
jgi:sarcosine oxidase subunit alpha